MSTIRVRFSGLILFSSNFLARFTGFIFTVLIARNLAAEELGIWFFLGSILMYFEIFENAMPYWAERDLPRGERVARTVLLFNLTISLPLMLLFIILSPSLASAIQDSADVFLIGSLFIPIYYVTTALTSILFSKEPHKVGAKDLIIDCVKIPLALLLLEYGLRGVLVAVILANLIFILYGVIVSRKYFESGINVEWIKERGKGVWLPLYSSVIGNITAAIDSFLTGVLLSSVYLAYYGIALVISKFLKMTITLISPVYPKILEKGKITERECRSLYKFHYIFSIPILVGGITLAPNLVTMFGSKYTAAAPLLHLLLPAYFLGSLSNIPRFIALGLEDVDARSNMRTRVLLSSKLFLVETIGILSLTILALGSLVTIPTFGLAGAAVARLLASIVGFIAYLQLVKDIVGVKTIVYPAGRPLIATIPLILTILIIRPVGTLSTIFTIGLSAAVYFTALIAIDKEYMLMFYNAVKEVKSRILYNNDENK